MSVNLDPKNQPPLPNNPQSKTHPKLSNFFANWVNLVYDGYQKESLPTQTYCLSRWKKIEKTSSSQAVEPFMKNCRDEIEEYKAFIRWYRSH